MLGLLALAAGPLAPEARAWGRAGHRVITQVAVYELPAAMQAFYFRHLAALVAQSNAADDRRATDHDEGPRHFIMLDHYAQVNPLLKIPHRYDDAVDKFSADTLARYGTLPWVVLEAKDKLAAAFTARDTAAILQLSADLSHYAADAYAPLHTTVNYDGQLSNQLGIQQLYETQLPERYGETFKYFGPDARQPKDALAFVWQALQVSYGFVNATFDLETKVSQGFKTQPKYAYAHHYGRTQRYYTPAFVAAYEEAAGNQVAYLLQQAAPAVASLWLAAWQQAGHPDLGTLMAPTKLTADEKTTLETQLKSWKANTLGQDQLLLAFQKEKKAEATDEIKAASGEMLAPPAPEAAPAPSPAPAAAAAPARPKPAATLAADGWDTPAAPAKVKTKTKGPTGTTKQKAKPALTGWE